MAVPRATFFFKDPGFGGGWSETHWCTTPDLAMKEVLNKAIDLGKLRAKMLANTILLHYIRVSDDLVRRDSLVAFTGPLGNEAGTDIKPIESAAEDLAPEMPYSTQLLRCESGSLYRKQLYLSGVPDVSITDPPGPVNSAGWQKNFNAWVKELKASWGFKVQQREPTNPLLAINDISVVAGAYVVTTSAAHGFTENQQVRVSNVLSSPAKFFNKIWTVGLTDPFVANKFIIKFLTPSGSYITGGNVQLRKQVVVPYTGILIRGETHRARGRFFGSPVGRRRRIKTV